MIRKKMIRILPLILLILGINVNATQGNESVLASPLAKIVIVLLGVLLLILVLYGASVKKASYDVKKQEAKRKKEDEIVEETLVEQPMEIEIEKEEKPVVTQSDVLDSELLRQVSFNAITEREEKNKIEETPVKKRRGRPKKVKVEEENTDLKIQEDKKASEETDNLADEFLNNMKNTMKNSDKM